MKPAGPAPRRGAYLTAANLVTVARLLLAIPIVSLYAGSGGRGGTLVFGLFVLAAVTDGVDGYLARSRGEVSDFGKLLDPVVDKVFGVAVFAALVWGGALPAWMMGTLVVKELLLVIGGLVLLRARNMVVAARKLGKAATVVLFVGWGGILAGLDQLGLWMTGIGLLLSLGAGVDYGLHAIRLLRAG